MPLTLLALLDLPLLPPPVLSEAMLLLADMLPTLLESSMSPRGPLMPSPRLRLMPTTVLTVILVLDMVDTAMVPTPMLVLAMDMVAMPTERGLLMPSPRLMPTMELTDMLVLAMLDM